MRAICLSSIVTTLTDDDLAKTTQVDVDGVENIQEFIEKNLAPDSKKLKK